MDRVARLALFLQHGAKGGADRNSQARTQGRQQPSRRVARPGTIGTRLLSRECGSPHSGRRLAAPAGRPCSRARFPSRPPLRSAGRRSGRRASPPRRLGAENFRTPSPRTLCRRSEIQPRSPHPRGRIEGISTVPGARRSGLREIPRTFRTRTIHPGKRDRSRRRLRSAVRPGRRRPSRFGRRGRSAGRARGGADSRAARASAVCRKPEPGRHRKTSLRTRRLRPRTGSRLDCRHRNH